ncbi:MAG: HAD family hydrolase [Myxococcales bacterium]|nr:MAG: HAD family hydrolase [Myxococcales bacterium]
MTPSTIAAFFDFDNTLLAGDGAKIGIRYMWERGEVSWRYLLRVVSANTLFKRNWLSAERMGRILLTFYKGQPLSKFESEADEYYRTYIKPRLAPTPLARLEAHRRAGHVLVLLTGSVRYLMTPVVRDLGFHHLICTDLETDAGGILTGRTVREICVGDVKVRRARELAETVGIDLTHSYAYGDHVSDLPLLESVGHPFVVEPQLALRRHAETRGWPILSFDLSAKSPPSSPMI